ncbi:MAG: RluA family pseudouridine synthase [Xanthobacteraceae bacterium]
MDARMTPEEMVARLLYRDGLMLIIDKPAGFAVHKGPKGGESLEDHFDALRFGLPRAPALAHRLDRDTSGCLVLGRHRKALAELGRLFKQGRVGKTYWAVVEGGPTEDEGRIDLPLGRLDESRGWWMKPDPHGQPAVTTWKVLGRCDAAALLEHGNASKLGAVVPHRSLPPCGGGTGREMATSTEPADTPLPNPPPRGGRERSGASGEGGGPFPGSPVAQFTWLALEPLTGRTHQLRVHCAAMGWPIVGDTIYGNAPRSGGPGLHLHAREVVVPLYKSRAPIGVSAPVPLHMHATLQACGWQGEVFRLVD